VPVPLLVRARALVPFCSRPLKVVEASSSPAFRVAAAPVSVTVPLPAREPVALENPLRSRVELTVKSEFALSPVVEPVSSVPALTACKITDTRQSISNRLRDAF
jgi:hypothetical protein